MGQQTRYVFILCAWVILAGCGEQAACGIAVRDAWIREPPPRSPAAGYLVIENNCTARVALVGAATAAAEDGAVADRTTTFVQAVSADLKFHMDDSQALYKSSSTTGTALKI